jgi:hypothetical protein
MPARAAGVMVAVAVAVVVMSHTSAAAACWQWLLVVYFILPFLFFQPPPSHDIMGALITGHE